MKRQIAVIDLGTNTCNLLIAEYQDKSYQILYQGKEVVKLGKNGIDKNRLTEDGLERAILAIRKHLERISQFSVSEVVIIATSAIRDATNQDWFQQQIKANTGLDLQIISGEKEAQLIFDGVKLAFDEIEDHSLILDIGGGSNEFILTRNNEPIWKQSFPLGMARIIEQIPPSNPITPEEIEQINDWFDSRLEPLWQQLNNIQIPLLIGCSGAFDTLADLIDQTNPGTKTRIKQEIATDDFTRVYETLIKSTTAERTEMKGMESIRIEMIVPSVLFIKLVIDRLNIKKIYQTDYALREGILYDRIFN
ncbi:exopolyphosphatase [Aquipluma nitroreducens]|uniref:Exopolyphosphatase n=1 Tax=Aquipluma nitroreducens TaxID=2010828 RepID=A0A5K7SER5_9BACT|nr:phosphatase [Aquipluma nitroreducens]BBE19969.1 exopolyphosphatase [Aquipluma nitroreducens]